MFKKASVAIIAILISACFFFGQTAGKPANIPQPSGTLTIAACQFPVSADISENAGWIKKQIKEAHSKGAEIVHFPECALSGYAGANFKSYDNFDWAQLYAETKEILVLADQLDLWLVLGSIHRLSDNHKPHNSLYLINPDGRIIDRYDKRFCTSGDLKYFSPGDHFVTFNINGIKCGLLICYDVRFPELYREYRKLGAQIIFQSFYNSNKNADHIHPKIMPTSARVRAATNYFFMSLTNTCKAYSWPCHLITPNGLIKARLPADEPGILINTIDTGKKYYDPSRPYRLAAINGALNSGETVNDARSSDRTIY